MKRACVIGWPVAHSRSPLVHGYWLRHYGIDGAYTKEAVPPEEIEAFLARLAARGYAGANVTLPHKAAALAAADVVEQVARAVVTYAEAGGWGRALVLEARRRGIASVGLQHGFIYRHWLNYRHELGFSIGYGYDAIAIALLGKSHPLGVVLASILFAAMRNGATRMQFLTQMPVDLISMLQALILLFVAADAIVRYIYRIKAKSERVVLTRGWGG